MNRSNLFRKIGLVIKEWTVRKIVIREKNGKIAAKCPLIFAVVGIIISPTLAIIVGITIFTTQCSFAIEREY